MSEPHRMPGRDGAFLSIQALRGIAALLVVVFHAGLKVDASEMTFRVGNAGVDIFFVISGFVMWTVTARRPIGPGAFLRQRIVRLAPLYWIFTLAMVAASVAAPSAFPHIRPDLMHAVLSLVFVPHLSPDSGLIMPILGQGWTLNFEVFFYLLFALALLLPAPRRLPAIGAALLALPALGLFVLTPAVPVTTLLSPLLIEFLGGIVIACLVAGGTRVAPAWCWLGLGLGVAMLCVAAPHADDDAVRLLEYGVPACLIVAGAVGAECAGALHVGALPRLLGDASYSIYLTHSFVISALAKFWPIGSPRWAFLLAASACSVPVGVAVYRCLERPLLAVLRGRRAPVIHPIPALSCGGSHVGQT